MCRKPRLRRPRRSEHITRSGPFLFFKSGNRILLYKDDKKDVFFTGRGSSGRCRVRVRVRMRVRTSARTFIVIIFSGGGVTTLNSARLSFCRKMRRALAMPSMHRRS